MVYRDQENYPASVETFRKMLTLGDENAKRGYQNIIDTYREAKQWTQGHGRRHGKRCRKLPNDREVRMVLERSTRRYRRCR